MDFEKICDKDNQGLYTLVFPNKHALPMDEIEAFFSQFDGFNDVRAAGTEKGYRFPRFKTSEGAKQAIEALAGHPTISLIPYVNKKKNNSSNQDGRSNKENAGNNNRFNSRKPDNSQSMWGADKPQVLKENSQNQGDSAKIIDGSAAEGKVSSVAMRLMKYKRDSTLIGEDTAESAEINVTRDENVSCNESNEVSDNNATNENKFVNSVVESSTADEGNEANRGNEVTSSEEVLAVNVNEVVTVNGVNGVKIVGKVNGFSEECNSLGSEVMEVSDEEIPGLVTRAGEVVVGNIHPFFGPAFVLHLFDRYEPLAVSTIQSVKSRYRYCHVYFKTREHATEVERQFDGYDLMGQKLLVLQPKTLVDSTPICSF